MEPEIHVAIVEDHKVTREGLATLIGAQPGFGITGCFDSMEKALAAVGPDPPDVMLLDIGLPGMSGIEGLRLLRDRYPRMQFLILTVYADDAHVFDAICAGACGYLLKETPPAKLPGLIREAHQGGGPMSPEIARKVLLTFQKVPPPKVVETNLSPRELAIVRLLAEGHAYKTAAAELCVSVDTIRFHVRNIYARLHVHSKSEAVLKALRTGLLA
ncbi:MAG: response regulator transcription factor [Bryobacteraceae bacterium]